MISNKHFLLHICYLNAIAIYMEITHIKWKNIATKINKSDNSLAKCGPVIYKERKVNNESWL